MPEKLLKASVKLETQHEYSAHDVEIQGYVTIHFIQ